ncbi:MAG: DegT/DnrJ/EryC1/StrS family aminotransferase [Sulfitobacter sp.]
MSADLPQDYIQVFSNSLGKEELDAVGTVFDSQWLGKGPVCDAFEADLATTLKTENFLLTSSGTASIFLAVKALDIKPGDEVIVSSINFIACASAIVEVGATPIFADVDPHTLNITADEITRLITHKTRAVIVLHYGGHPCDMEAILQACGSDIAIIEDAAVAFPASINGRACGTFGDIGVFSFNAVKAVSMGDGGGLAIRDTAVAELAKSHRFLGLGDKTRSGLDALTKSKPTRWWEYELQEIAGRHISNDILAAIGRVQLKKLPATTRRRKKVWDTYQKAFAGVEGLLRPPEPAKGYKSAYFMYWIQVGDKRDALAAYLAENGVYCTFRYYPLHLIKHFNSDVVLPGAELANEITLNIPLHQNLTDAHLEKIIGLVKTFLSEGRT